MSIERGGVSPSSSRSAGFVTTHWSVVLAAGGQSAPARRALAALCEAYWYPLYAFVRRRGHSADDARDLTQGYFTKLMEADTVAAADRERGRFRSFLLVSLKNYLADERDRARAAKRGGGRAAVPLGCVSIDGDAAERQYSREPSHGVTPERLYDRRWALTLLDRVLAAVGERYAAEGKAALFERLKPFIGGDGGAGTAPYGQVAADLATSEGAVKVAVHRLRRRYGDALRASVADTVESPQAVDDEIRDLFAAVAHDARPRCAPGH